MRTYLVSMLVLAVVFVQSAGAQAAESPALARARTLYNSGDYEGAIDAASVSRREAQWADASALVIARARLERYRQTMNASELADARDALQAVKAASLTPRDQVDLLIGLGQALYLGEVYGPSAELFGTALDKGSALDKGTALEKGTALGERDRMMLLDWWATALDRDAQTRPYDRRATVYQRIAERMELELRGDPANGVASYWQVVAARGTGDLDRAWSAAIAAWVRSTLNPATQGQLRGDLDRVMEQALIPERARSNPAREGVDAVEMLRAEWSLVKENWK
jgi:hypothetical protein